MWKYDNLSQVQAELLKKRIIDLHGDVDQNMFLYVREAFMRLTTEDSPDVMITITSNGGDVFIGLSIFDVIANYAGKKTGLVTGYARSMAVVILQACNLRKAARHSYFLTHHISRSSISLDVMRNKKKMSNARAELEKSQKRLYKILIDKTGKSQKEVTKLNREGKDITSEEALSFGLIDEVI